MYISIVKQVSFTLHDFVEFHIIDIIWLRMLCLLSSLGKNAWVHLAPLSGQLFEGCVLQCCTNNGGITYVHVTYGELHILIPHVESLVSIVQDSGVYMCIDQNDSTISYHMWFIQYVNIYTLPQTKRTKRNKPNGTKRNEPNETKYSILHTILLYIHIQKTNENALKQTKRIILYNIIIH